MLETPVTIAIAIIRPGRVTIVRRPAHQARNADLREGSASNWARPASSVTWASQNARTITRSRRRPVRTADDSSTAASIDLDATFTAITATMDAAP